jgi:hypothetical protein
MLVYQTRLLPMLQALVEMQFAEDILVFRAFCKVFLIHFL